MRETFEALSSLGEPAALKERGWMGGRIQGHPRPAASLPFGQSGDGNPETPETPREPVGQPQLHQGLFPCLALRRLCHIVCAQAHMGTHRAPGYLNLFSSFTCP